MEQPLRILLVDDETLLLDSLEIILSLSQNMSVIGKAHDGQQALSVLKERTADLALVDLNMEGMGGIELIHQIKTIYPSMKVLVLTTFYDENNIQRAIANGADGYILKDSGRESMLQAIEQIMHGQSVLDQKVLQTLSKLMASKGTSTIPVTTAPTTVAKEELSQSSPLLMDLTKREREICSMLAEGYSNSQISKFLYLSEGTVKNYMTSIYDKTNIHDRVSLVVYLRELFHSQ
ncbi:response regulator [Anaerosporobacter faecicola]|uniref:response regulator n=1 Tax=Anaerosporobacter faecicola TaxID=2718714 RepID=UPI00143954BF|nr:response regulator transcription factor [Anaerosporobacter faecicola]